MNDPRRPSVLDDAPSPARWFWVASVAAYLWYLMNASAFFFRLLMTSGNIQTVEGQQMMAFIPAWVNIFYAGEVLGGAIGCMGLLRRRRWALGFFVVSVIGALGQSSYLHLLSGTARLIGTSAAMAPLLDIVVGAGMIALARTGITRGWLR